MKRFSLLLLSLLLCSCSHADYISIVTNDADTQFEFLTDTVETTDTAPRDTQEQVNTSNSTDTQTIICYDSITDTEPSEETTAPPGSESISVTHLTEKVKRGNKATLSVKGIAGTEYSIAVYYSSTVSTAKGLEPQTADPDGNVTWSWRVGSRTKPGRHRIVISGGGESTTLYFTTE